MPAVFGYWKLRGLAQHIRLLLEYTGEDYNEKLYEITAGPNPREQWLNEKLTLGMALPNLPYYFDGSHKITQSNAIMRYIGRKHDLCGKTEEEIIKVDMLENQAMDFRLAWARLCYNADEYETNKVTYVSETLPTLLELLNNFIGNNKWFVGDKITIVDFLFYELFDINKHLAPDCLNKFKNLQDFVTRFESLESIKKYMKSPKFISKPINGPMAVFGGK